MQPAQRQRRHQRDCRRGATIAEAAIVLSISVVLLLGMMELSVALVRYTSLCEAARRVAREAIVHGSLAPPAMGRWGPAPLDVSGTGDEPAAQVAREILISFDPAQVVVELRWLDGTNDADARVQATVRYTHQPIISVPGVFGTTELIGRSTMRIAH